MTQLGRGEPSRSLNMEGETDGTLLYYGSCRESEDDRAISDAAMQEFHRRYMQGLYGRCARMCAAAGVSSDFAADLAAAAFSKAIQKGGTFVDLPDVKGPSNRTSAWLGKIAKNLLVDSLRNPFRPGLITGAQTEIPIEDYSDEEFAVLLCAAQDLPRTAVTIRLVQQAMQTVDERTRTVLVQTVLQAQRSPGRRYMYRGSAEALAQHFETTQENIRRIRRAGMRAIKEYVQRNSRP